DRPARGKVVVSRRRSLPLEWLDVGAFLLAPAAAAPALRMDQVQHQRRPSEIDGALTRGGVWVEKLAHAAAADHLNGALGQLGRDIAIAMRPQAPVKVVVAVDPRRTAPGDRRAVLGVEAGL